MVEVQDKEAIIASLEEESKEAKAQVEVLSTQLLESQQAVDSHTDRAAELQLRSWSQRVDGRLVMATMMDEDDGVRRD